MNEDTTATANENLQEQDSGSSEDEILLSQLSRGWCDSADCNYLVLLFALNYEVITYDVLT